MDGQLYLCFLAGVPFLGMLAQWLAWRFRLPSILLLLAIGIGLGFFVNPDELLGRVTQSDASVGPTLLFPIVSLAVAVILFEGGLTLRLSELKEAGTNVLRLCTIGVAVSWGLTALAAWLLLEMAPPLAVLIGALLVVTGPTVIAPLLRHIQPARRIGSIVKWEGIVIDPIGAVLAVLVFQVVVGGGDITFADVVMMALKTAAIGVFFGLGVGVLLVRLVERYLIPDYLQGVVFLTSALALFALSNFLQDESGLVTVTLFGIYLANQKRVSVKHIVEFKENLVVLLVSCLFIVLGARIEASTLIDFGWRGAFFLLALILIVRPASVFAAGFRSGLHWREKLFLGFMAPRGIVAAAVASVFSLEFAHIAHQQGNGSAAAALAEQALQLAPLTFLVIVGTVSVYGLGAAPLARWLGLADPNPQGVLFAGADYWIREIASALHQEGITVALLDTNYSNVAAARMAGLNAHCISVLSEYVHEELDLAGIGRLLALTPNDEVNSLASIEFAHHFGRKNVFQLAPWDRG